MRPGIMVYFDIRPCLNRLTCEQKGLLFEAMLDYGESGIVPDFGQDVALAVAWDFIKPKIDRDTIRYQAQVLQKRYAAFVREVKKSGDTPPSFDEWRSSLADGQADKGYREESPDTGRYPTATTTTTPTTTTTATPTATLGVDESMEQKRTEILRLLKVGKE